MIIYLYYNRPRKPQRGPCNVRGHTDATLPRGTREAEGRSQDGLTLPGRTDAHPPAASTQRSQASPHRARTELAASQGLRGFTSLVTAKPDRLNHPLPQPHNNARMDRWTPKRCPSPCRSAGQPPGCQAGRCPYRTSCLMSRN